MDAQYRVRFAGTLSDQLIGDFPFEGTSFEARIGAAGAMSGNIPIARGDSTFGARVAAIHGSAATTAYVYRNGVPWWGGPVWTKTLASDENGGRCGSMDAATFESYLDRVLLATDLPALPGTDQMDIARSFINHMQSDPHANVGLTCDTIQSGIIRDRVLYAAASRPSYLKMLSDLAALDQGFEFVTQVLTDPTTGARMRRLRLGYPILSSGVTHRISRPGAILSYSFPEDGTRAATSLMATGSGANSSVHTNAGAYAAGYPRTDLTTSYSSITDIATLEAHATADLALVAPPFGVPAVRVRLDATDITPQCLGDSVRISIVDELFPAGVTATYRLVGMTVAPEERGRYETCDLILN